MNNDRKLIKFNASTGFSVVLEFGNTEEKIENQIKSGSNIKYKKDSNGELDLDFLDIPAFLRKQAD